MHSLRQTLRSAGGVLLCASTLIVCLFVAQIVMLPLQLFGGPGPSVGELELAPSVGIGELEIMAVPLVQRLLSWAGRGAGPEAWAQFLLRDRPGMLSVLFVLLVYVVPTIVVFANFHQISSDSRNHGLRYLLLRARRSEIYLGKFAAGVVMAFLLLGVLTLTVVLYVHLALARYPAAAVVSWGIRGAAALTALSVPFIALALAFSAVSDSGIGNLGAALGVAVVYPFIVSLLASRVWAPLDVLAWLLPYRAGLLTLHPSWAVALAAVAACLGYAAVYLFLGLLVFRKRSL